MIRRKIATGKKGKGFFGAQRYSKTSGPRTENVAETSQTT